MTISKYEAAEGFWKVTTEGDEEGRTVRDLGVYFGFIDEIAFSLADKCFYSLCFKLVEPVVKLNPKKNKVNISLDIDSGTWGMNAEDRASFVGNLLKDRDVMVKKSTYFASVEISLGKSLEQQKLKEKEILQQQALAKLTIEEKKSLGLI